MYRRTFLKGIACLLIAPFLPEIPFQTGDYAERESLADLLDKAKPGDVIIIGPGEYYSDRPLVIKKGCTLIADGVNCVVRGAPNYILRIEGRNEIRLINSDIRSESGHIVINNLNSRYRGLCSWK